MSCMSSDVTYELPFDVSTNVMPSELFTCLSTPLTAQETTPNLKCWIMSTVHSAGNCTAAAPDVHFSGRIERLLHCA